MGQTQSTEEFTKVPTSLIQEIANKKAVNVEINNYSSEDVDSIFESVTNSNTTNILTIRNVVFSRENAANLQILLEKISSLQILTLVNMKFSHENDVEKLSIGLKRNTSIKYLGLIKLESILELFVEGLSCSPSIVHLSFADVQFETASLAKFSKAFKNNNTLSLLEFQNCNLNSEEAGMTMCDILCHNSGIKDLSIKSSKLGSEGMRTFFKQLTKQSDQTILKRFSSWDNGLGDNSTSISLGNVYQKASQSSAYAMKSLGEFLKVTSKLEILILMNESFSENAILNLSIGLQENKSLKTLVLYSLNINDQGAKFLCHNMRLNVDLNLNIFNIGGNLISDEGMVFFSELLKLNNSLKDINLMKNSLRSEGMRLISSGLLVNMNICEINLSHNMIGDEGLLWLSEVLKVNDNIQILVLDNCNISSKGTCYLLQCLKVNKGLKWLSLNYNNMTANNGFITLAEALLYNYTLKSLSLMNCSLRENDILFLLKIIQNKKVYNDSESVLEVLIEGNNINIADSVIQSELNKAKSKLILK